MSNIATTQNPITTWSTKSGKEVRAYMAVSAQRAPLARRQLDVATAAAIKAAEHGHWGEILSQIRAEFEAKLPKKYMEALRGLIHTTLRSAIDAAKDDREALKVSKAALALPPDGLPMSNDTATARAFFQAIMDCPIIGKAKNLPVPIRDAQVYGTVLGFSCSVIDAAPV